MANKNIELRSVEVQEILGKPPSWIVSWGTTVIFIAFLLLIFVAWWVKYPDMVYSRVALTSPQPPVSIFVKNAGPIEQILVNDKDIVEQGSILAIMETNADYEDILKVDSLVKVIQRKDQLFIKEMRFPKILNLGEIQYAYAAMLKQHSRFKYKANNQYSLKNIGKIRDLINNEKRVIGIEISKKSKVIQRLNNYRNILDRKKKLFEAGAISRQELNKYSDDFIQEKTALDEIEESITEAKKNIDQYEKQVIGVQQGDSDGNNLSYTDFKESANLLQEKIMAWQDKYLIKASFSGRIAFYEDWQAHQYIDTDKELLAIVPESEGVVGQLLLSAESKGKTEKGQKVLVKLDGYPFMEYGILEGQVKKIAEVPKEGNYRVEIIFPDGMTTDRGEVVQFVQRMEGAAEIVTEQKRLSTRFFDRLMIAYEKFI